MAAYAPLLEIVATHAYFADGRCRGLVLAPTAATAAWLREIDGRCRDTGSGLLVVGDPKRLDLATPAPQGLAWVLRCEDARFAAVTAQLPAPGAVPRDPQPVGDDWPAHVEPPRADLMWFQPSSDDPSSSEQRLHVGAHAGAGDIWPLTWPALSEHLGAAERRRPPLGLVQLPALRATHVANGPRRYRIHFAARAPVWKYCLVGHWSDDPLEVVASPGALPTARALPAAPRASTFGPPKSEKLPDGRPVLAFLSSQGIELRERPERRFALRSATDQRVLLDGLPSAGADHFVFEPIGDRRELVSEIFVHR